MMLAWLLGVVLSLLVLPGSAHAAAEAICSDPAVLFCDNFEDRAVGTATWLDLQSDKRSIAAKTSRWNVSGTLADGNGFFGDDTVAFSGSRSLRLDYPACSWSDGSDHPCGAGFGAADGAQAGISHNDLYVRHYVRFGTQFAFSMINTKHLFHNQAGGGRPPLLVVSGFDAPFVWFIQDEPATDQFFSTTAVVRDQWICVEEHFRNVSGDKAFTLWINGVVAMNLTNADVPVGFMNTSPWTDVSQLEGHWNTNPVASAADCSHEFMTYTPPNVCSKVASAKWYDNIVVSTQRINCLATLPPPTAPCCLTVTWLFPIVSPVFFGAGAFVIAKRRRRQHAP